MYCTIFYDNIISIAIDQRYIVTLPNKDSVKI